MTQQIAFSYPCEIDDSDLILQLLKKGGAIARSGQDIKSVTGPFYNEQKDNEVWVITAIQVKKGDESNVLRHP